MDLNDLNFDDIVKEDAEKEDITLVEQFAKERLTWTKKIKKMSNQLKHIKDVSELMIDVYTERQQATEYYYYLMTVFSKINKEYRKQWAKKYDFYSYQSQKRFPNEKSKELHILFEIKDIVEKREAIDNHAKFILDTKGTIDNIIYGIKYRIDLEKLKSG